MKKVSIRFSQKKESDESIVDGENMAEAPPKSRAQSGKWGGGAGGIGGDCCGGGGGPKRVRKVGGEVPLEVELEINGTFHGWGCLLRSMWI